MTHTVSHDDAAPRKRSKLFVYLPWVGTGLFIILIAGVTTLFAIKHLVFVSTGTTASTSVVTRACGVDIIAKYNASFTTSSKEAASSALKTAFDAATSAKNYAADPNCVYIRYQYYADVQDTANAQKQIDTLQALADKRLYATSEILNVQTIDALRLDLKLMNTPATQTDQSTNGQG